MGQDRSRKLILARHWDREALSRSLTELSQNESGLLETLQDVRGVYRTSEEVFVAVVKVVTSFALFRRDLTLYFVNQARQKPQPDARYIARGGFFPRRRNSAQPYA